MKVRSYQIFFKYWQSPLLEKDFVPYDNQANPRPEWREYHVFREAFFNKLMQDSLVGFQSWKFREKTQISGERFLDFVRQNPGYQVYFINPFVEEAALYLNVWKQGEIHHPGITKLAQHIFDRLGYNCQLDELVMPVEKTLYCNFFVADEAFWKAYLDFCEPIYHLIESGLEGEFAELLSSRADKLIDADYRAFIFERLFSTFLTMNPQIRACSYEYSPDELAMKYKGLAPYIQRLRSLKDQMARTDADLQSRGQFLSLSREARESMSYGFNASWWKRQVHELFERHAIKRRVARFSAPVSKRV